MVLKSIRPSIFIRIFVAVYNEVKPVFELVDTSSLIGYFLSASSGEACTSRDLFSFHFFLSPEFRELWRSGMSILLFTEVKRQCATLVLGWLTS